MPSSSSPSKELKSAKKMSTHSVPQSVPSFRRSHLPSEEDVNRLKGLSAPHVESFDYFLEMGLVKAVQDIVPCEIDIVDFKAGPVDVEEVDTAKFWVENVKIAKPTKQVSTKGGQSSKLIPRECRELGFMYSGAITGEFCFQVVQHRNGVEIPGRVFKIPRLFGKMPIMVGSKACHLRGLIPSELANLREEVSLIFKASHWCVGLKLLSLGSPRLHTWPTLAQ
jgi:DNA-directed RNA polymerase I subunit RPA2